MKGLNPQLLSLKTEGEPSAKEYEQPLEARKGDKMDSALQFAK